MTIVLGPAIFLSASATAAYANEPPVKYAGTPTAARSWDEAYSPDPHEPLWLDSDSGMIDAGPNPDDSAFRDTGIARILGKAYLGRAPDIGSVERGLGWTKPGVRSGMTGDGLAYSLPSFFWRVADHRELSGFQDLGAPATFPEASVVVVQDAPGKRRAWVAVRFEPGVMGDAAWQKHQEFLDGRTGKELVMQDVPFRDGFDAYFSQQGDTALLNAFAIDARGIWRVTGGTKASDLFSPQDLITIQDDIVTFARSSLMLGSYNFNTAHYVTLPTPAFLSVGSAAAGSTSDALTPGELTGRTQMNSTMFTFTFAGDLNRTSEVEAWIRRQGQADWERAYAPFRVENLDPYRREFVGFVDYLAPATTYAFRLRVSDSDGVTGGDTATTKTYETSFTTRCMPQVFRGGRIFEVFESDKGSRLDAMLRSALPGDTFHFHIGNYGTLLFNQPGTQDKPILYQGVEDGVIANFILISNDNTWVDGFTVEMTYDASNGIQTYHKGNDQNIHNVVITRTEVIGPAPIDSDDGTLYNCIKAEYVEDFSVLDSKLHGTGGLEPARPDDSPYYRYHLPSATNTSIATYQQSTDGQEIYHNEVWWVTDTDVPRNNAVAAYNYLHDTRDDMESDNFFRGAVVAKENRFNHTGPVLSTQSGKGGPYYFIGNIFPGSFNTVKSSLKFRSYQNGFFAKNSGYVNNEASTGCLFNGFGNNDEGKGNVVAGNYLKAFDPNGTAAAIGSQGPPSRTDFMGAFGWNAYEKAEDDEKLCIWNAPLDYGGEKNSIIVSSRRGDTQAPTCGGGGGGGGNQAPTANDKKVIVRQNKSSTIQLTGSDPEGAQLTFALGQGPSSGTLSNFDAATGKITYTPTLDFAGDDSFTFTVSDGAWTSQPGTISIKVVIPVPVDKTGLVGHWKFDETSGATAADSSRNENHGTLSGGPVWTAGKVGGALAFDGVNDHITIPDNDGLDIEGALTMAGWFKIEALDIANNGILFGKNVDGNLGGSRADSSYEFGFRNASLGGWVNNGTNGAWVSGEGRPFADNNWHHLVFLWDGTTNPNGLKIYADGAETYTATSPITPPLLKTGFSLGINDKDDREYRTKGTFDEIYLFSRALTEGEILTLASEETLLCMDANGDGTPNLQDIVTMVQMLVGKTPTPTNICHLDLNKDGAFNVADVVLGIRHVLNGTTPTCDCEG